MNSASRPINPKLLAFQLALLIAMTPFALDTYLPAFKYMASEFGVSVQLMGRTVSTYLIGFALGQLIGGPLSDLYGRKRVGSIGLTIFIIGSVQIIASDGYHDVLLWRLLQALGGGLSSVVVAPIVRDNFQGRDSAKVFAMMGMIAMVAPMVAPIVGSLLLQVTPWQGIFWFLIGYALLLLLILVFYIPRSKQSPARDSSLPTYYIRSYGQVFQRRIALPHLLSQALISGVLFTFVTNAAFIFIDFFGVSESRFPLVFGTIVATNVVLSRVNVRLLNRFSPLRILLLGCAIQLVGCMILATYTALVPSQLEVIWGLMIIVVGCVGLIYGNNLSLYLEHFPNNSGAANAIFGCCSFAAGGVAGAISSTFHSASLLPLMLIMTGCSLLGTLTIWLIYQFHSARD